MLQAPASLPSSASAPTVAPMPAAAATTPADSGAAVKRARFGPAAEIEHHVADVTVTGLLAEGAWGSVYSGRRANGEAVAIRRVEQAFVGDQSLIDRFVSSVRTAADLDHPHILPIHELVELDTAVLIVMPKSESNLADLERPIALADACIATLSLLEGLQAAHRQGIFHGDVRPRNALIDSKRHVVVSDVGLAAPLQSNARTMVRFDGTDWMHRAPEAILGRAIGAYTDVYAVGSIAYEMFAGQPPRITETRFTALVAAANDPTPPPPLPPHVPAEIVTTLMYSLVNDPAYRWASVADFSASLLIACEKELGAGWAYKSQFILEQQPTSGMGRQSSTVIRAFGS